MIGGIALKFKIVEKNFLKNFAFENSSQINDIQNLINSCKNAY